MRANFVDIDAGEREVCTPRSAGSRYSVSFDGGVDEVAAAGLKRPFHTPEQAKEGLRNVSQRVLTPAEQQEVRGACD